MADKNEIIKMLNEELEKKVDGETLNRLKGAKTKKEALAILEETSIKLDDEILDAVSGGDDDNTWECGANCLSREVCFNDTCAIVNSTGD